MQQSGAQKVKQCEWYSKNHMGHIVCKLCQTEHRDDANFLQHMESKKHLANLDKISKAKEIYAKQQDSLRRLHDMQRHDAHAETIGSLAGGLGLGSVPSAAGNTGDPQQSSFYATTSSTQLARAPRVGKPEVNGPHFEMLLDGCCRVVIELHFPLAVSDGVNRPMHRWMNTYEQTVETRDDNKVYLVFACEPYESIAFTFPSRLVPSEFTANHNRNTEHFFCEWDPIARRYYLLFTLTDESAHSQ